MNDERARSLMAVAPVVFPPASWWYIVIRMATVAMGATGIRGRRSILTGAIVLVLLIPTVGAQAPDSPISPTDRVAIERAALGRARTRMLGVIQSQPLKDNTTVGKWAGGDVSLDRALRMWVRSQPTYGAPRVFSDRTGEVDIRILPDELARQLTALVQQFPAAAESLSASDIAAAAKRWPFLWATGVIAEPLPERARIDGWEDVTAAGVQAARRAASDDAIYALLEEAAKLRVSAAHRLSEFLSGSAAVEEAVLAGLRIEASVKVELAPDQVAVAEATIAIPALIRILTDVHGRLYEGDDFQSPDFREMALSAGVATISGAGLAAPPARYFTKPRYETIELDEPLWTATTLTTTGIYVPEDAGDLSPAQREQVAMFDGIDRLRRMVESIELKKGVTVEQFVGYHRQLKDDVVIFLGGARAVSRPEPRNDGGVGVRVELPLKRLWWILRRGMKTVEVEPTTHPAGAPPAASQPIAPGVG